MQESKTTLKDDIKLVRTALDFVGINDPRADEIHLTSKAAFNRIAERAKLWEGFAND